MRLLSMLIVLVVVSCSPSSNDSGSTPKSTQASTTPTPTGTIVSYTPPPNTNQFCFQKRGQRSPSKPGAQADFTTLSIIAPGKGNSPNVSAPSWSSTSLSERTFLITDSFHTYRLAVMDAPGVNGVDCRNFARYGALDVTVGVKAPGASSYSSTYTFRRAGLYTCQTSPKLTVPRGLSVPPVVEIFNVKWDRCNNGYNDPEVPRQTPPVESVPCPMNPFWVYDCFQIQLDVATDYTYDIPT